MSSRSPDLVKRMTDVVDEIIPTIPVDDRTSALITHIARCVLEAAEQQDNYMTLLAVASAERSASREGRSVPHDCRYPQIFDSCGVSAERECA